MINRTLKQIHEMVGGLNDISKWESVNIAGVSIDSRKGLLINLFVPLRGEQVDGHRYVEKAIGPRSSCGFMATRCSKSTDKCSDYYWWKILK